MPRKDGNGVDGIACGDVLLCENYASTRTIIVGNTPLTYECSLIYGFPHHSRTHCPSRGPQLVLTDRIEFPRNPPSHPRIIFNRAITRDYYNVMDDSNTSGRMILCNPIQKCCNFNYCFYFRENPSMKRKLNHEKYNRTE